MLAVVLVQFGREFTRLLPIPPCCRVVTGDGMGTHGPRIREQISVELHRKGDASGSAFTDISHMTWLDREHSWLVGGKNVYLARADTVGIDAFTTFLDRQGADYVIDVRDDVVVFSSDRLREWCSAASEAA